ncbi:MAG TPA: trehalose-phosphatase [Acidobacteriota bacterium]|nr:trehalose-phosphatase [Acidobacteriota bacterium]
MKVLNPGVKVDAFFHRLTQAERSVLFLDYDGTLAPFKSDPAQAFPYEGIPELICELSSKPCIRLVIVTGRLIEDVISLLSIQQVPEIWGSHGREQLYPGGRLRKIKLSPAEKLGLERASQWAVNRGIEDWLEAKTGCLALHFRGKPESRVASVESAARLDWEKLAAETGLELHEFDGGLELRTAGRNKGIAVSTVLDEMAPDVPAAYLGDDLTDEDAFAALAGRGLSVLVREELRKTRADLWIKPPQDLIEFLETWKQSTCHSLKS